MQRRKYLIEWESKITEWYSAVVELPELLELLRGDDGGIGRYNLADNLARVERAKGRPDECGTMREYYRYTPTGRDEPVTDMAEPDRPPIPFDLGLVLDWVHLKHSEYDMEIVCQECGLILGDAEDDDSLGLLARAAIDHMPLCPKGLGVPLDQRAATSPTIQAA